MVTLIDPMTRGLKDGMANKLRNTQQAVTLIDPMTRGLKEEMGATTKFSASELH